MSITGYLSLNLADKGTRDWDSILNDNFSKIDAGYGGQRGVLSETYLLTDTFNGTTGVTVTLPKSVSAVSEYSVTITPTTRTASIGDIEVERSTADFVVKSHGNNTADDFMAVVCYTGDVSSYGVSIYHKWYVSPEGSISDHSDDSVAGSMAWILDQVGAAPVYLEFPGNTTYTLDDNVDVTAGSNDVFLVFQSGALLKPASGKTVTVFSPENIIASPRQQVFDISNNSLSPVTFSYGGTAWVDWMEKNADPAVATTDMSDAINALESALHNTKGGGTLRFNNSEYMIGSTITKSPTVSWLGNSGGRSATTDAAYGWTGGDSYATVIQLDPAWSDNKVFDFNNDSTSNAWVRYRYMKGFHIIGVLGSDDNTLFEMNYIRQYSFQDMQFQKFNIGFYLQNSGELYFKRVYGIANNFSVDGYNVSDSWFEECHFGGGSTTAGHGLYLRGSSSLSFINTRFQITENGGLGANFRNCYNLKFTDCTADQNEGGGVRLDNCQVVQSNNFALFENGKTTDNQSGAEIYTRSFDVVAIDADDITNNTLTLEANHYYYGSNKQVELSTTGTLPTGLSTSTRYWPTYNDTTEIKLSESKEDAVAGTYVDIIDAGSGTHTVIGIAEDITFNGGMVYDRYKDTSTEKQDTGIFLGHFSSGTSVEGKIDNIIFMGVNLSGVTGAFNLGGLDEVENILKIVGCIGITMSGNGSIPSGGPPYIDTITHNLPFTPQANEIMITLKENPDNTPGAVWVAGITSTTFDVKCENDPGASNLDFAWRIIKT